MKKFIYLMAAMLMVMGISSCKCSGPNVEPIEGYDFNTVLVADYAAVKADYPTAVFYESQVVLNASPAETLDLYPVSITNVYQADTNVVFVTHYEGKYADAPTVEVVKGFWLEDLEASTEPVLSFSDALTKIEESNAVRPTSNLMTYRRPLYKDVYPFAFYIFGGSDEKVYLWVNSGTGDVISDIESRHSHFSDAPAAE